MYLDVDGGNVWLLVPFFLGGDGSNLFFVAAAMGNFLLAAVSITVWLSLGVTILFLVLLLLLSLFELVF
jgi:hypothetical protein